MRKLLLGLLVVVLLALSVYTVIYGISIGGLEIPGIPELKEENLKLDTKIQTATKLKNSDYPQNVTTLESAYKKLMSEKENYEQILALGVDENGQPLSKIQEYEVEKIWVTMGNYAKKQGVELKMDVTSNNSISQTYDLKFSVVGGYIQITDFLYDVERDSTLVFKLENFKMLPTEDTNVLIGSFTCKDVKLNISDINTLNGESSSSESDTDVDKKASNTSDADGQNDKTTTQER